MKIAEIYVSITGYLLQFININLSKINSQRVMLAHSLFCDIPIDTYKQEMFPTFILRDVVYITYPLE